MEQVNNRNRKRNLSKVVDNNNPYVAVILAFDSKGYSEADQKLIDMDLKKVCDCEVIDIIGLHQAFIIPENFSICCVGYYDDTVYLGNGDETKGVFVSMPYEVVLKHNGNLRKALEDYYSSLIAEESKT